MPKRKSNRSILKKEVVVQLTIGLVIGIVILLFASLQMHATEDQSMSVPSYSNAP